MAMTRLSTKGQLVVPKATRERMGLTPGTSFKIIEEGNRVIFERSEPFAPTTLGDVVGIPVSYTHLTLPTKRIV